MATLYAPQWEESDDWRSIVAEPFHADFQRVIAEAISEGTPIESVLTVGGVPVVFNSRP